MAALGAFRVMNREKRKKSEKKRFLAGRKAEEPGTGGAGV